MSRKKVTEEVLEEMKKLRGEGLSYGKIADRLGLAPMTVYNHLREKGRPGLIGRLKRRLAQGGGADLPRDSRGDWPLALHGR